MTCLVLSPLGKTPQWCLIGAPLVWTIACMDVDYRSNDMIAACGVLDQVVEGVRNPA
jgi:hypothetical protein